METRDVGQNKKLALEREPQASLLTTVSSLPHITGRITGIYCALPAGGDTKV